MTPFAQGMPGRYFGPEPGSKSHTVLQAARKVFLTHGFSATTDMIQQMAGVSKSTVYAHYANKETLFSAVIEAECQSFSDKVSAIRFQSGKLKDTLAALGSAYLDIVLTPEKLALYRIVIAEAPRFPRLAHKFYEAGPNAVVSIVARYLDIAVTSRELELGALKTEELALVFISSIRSEPHLFNLTHPDKSLSPQKTTAWVEMVVNSFIHSY